ncbi:MAG: flagellar basal body-associated protein FliL [Bdellovibrionales bacterium]
MTESKAPANSPKVEGEKPSFEVGPGMMSLDELDKVIEQADPEALQKIETVREIRPENTAHIELLELDDFLNRGGSSKLKSRLQYLKSRGVVFWIWAKRNFLELSVRAGQWALRTVTESREQISSGFKAFAQWPRLQKIGFSFAVLLSVGVLIFSYFAFVKGSFRTSNELFMTSLLSLSEKTETIAADAALETFYNSSRIPKSIFNLKKMVINIEPSQNSGPNPMVAYEFSLEGNSTEVLIEIKDREGEILDQIQRMIEEHSFDELNSADGKKLITEKVRSTVNRLLTLGKIRHVYIQGVIFKP